MLAFLKIHAACPRTAAEFRMTKLNPVRSSWKAPCPMPTVTQFSRITDSSRRDYVGAMRKTAILTGNAFYQEEKHIIHKSFRSMGEKVAKFSRNESWRKDVKESRRSQKDSYFLQDSCEVTRKKLVISDV